MSALTQLVGLDHEAVQPTLDEVQALLNDQCFAASIEAALSQDCLAVDDGDGSLSHHSFLLPDLPTDPLSTPEPPAEVRIPDVQEPIEGSWTRTPETLPDKPLRAFYFRFRCINCGKDFASMQKLVQHRKQVHRKTCFSCLQKERETAMAKKGNICTVCGKAFEFQSRLRNHMAKHLDTMPHRCNLCTKGFPSASALEAHMRTHTGAKPFKCDVCEKSFRQKSYLTVHMRTHSKEKLYRCDLCDKGFNFRSQLLVHKNSSVHRIERPVICPLCTRDFTTNHALRKHIGKFHSHVSAESIDKLIDDLNAENEGESGGDEEK